MSRKYSLEPVKVSRIETKYRRIVTPTLPTPGVIKLIRELEKHEPRSMFGQVPIGIKRTYGINVEDLDGNIFLDATSGVLVTNIDIHMRP